LTTLKQRGNKVHRHIIGATNPFRRKNLNMSRWKLPNQADAKKSEKTVSGQDKFIDQKDSRKSGGR